MLDDNGAGASYLTKLVQTCWTGQTIPEAWHLAQVALIFKKGKVEDCSNYRPLSLVNVADKVYALIILNRLKRSGAEARIWQSQYGFRRGRSTTDALHVVRRRIEAAWA